MHKHDWVEAENGKLECDNELCGGMVYTEIKKKISINELEDLNLKNAIHSELFSYIISPGWSKC